MENLDSLGDSDMKARRPRIPFVDNRVKPIVDTLEFTSNLCSAKARSIAVFPHKIEIELWFDKHYHDRDQHGDENGKREDIDPKSVEDLVRASITHLMFYSSLIKGFNFLNPTPSVGAPNRVILKRESADSMLNVVIQAHYAEINKFQITVKTAMCVDDFRVGNGQYTVEIFEGGSVLRKKDNNKFINIASI